MSSRLPLIRLKERLDRISKDFLFSDRSREFFLFLFFFFVAGAFWLLQTLNGEFEDTISLPFRLKGVPKEVVITSQLPTELQLRVKDRGTVLLNYKLGGEIMPLSIDFEKLKGNDNHVRMAFAQIEKQILQQMSVSTRLLSIKPDTLDFYYTQAKSKRVPVRFQGRLMAAQTYFLADTLFRPDSVEVYAPQAILDTLCYAPTVFTECLEVADTLIRKVQLTSHSAVKFLPDEVEMSLLTDVYTEASVELPLEGVNFPMGKVLRAFPSHVKVLFQVGKNRYKSLSEEEFRLIVNYEELMKLNHQKYTVKLHHLPQGVLNVRFVPEQVDFLIEQVSFQTE